MPHGHALAPGELFASPAIANSLTTIAATHGEAFYRGELADPGGYGGIPKDRRSCHARRDLLEQIQPFRAQTVVELQKAGGVAAWLRQIGRAHVLNSSHT